MKKTCVHMHLRGAQRTWQPPPYNDQAILAAEQLGINSLWTSIPVTYGDASLDRVQEANNAVFELMERYFPLVQGVCFINPGLGQEALNEIDRCLDGGMIGVKMYNQHRYSDPVVFPVAEKAIARGVPVLGHAAYLFHQRLKESQPRTSNGQQLCDLANRYPELKLIMAHINGGGDWEWQIKAIRNCPSVFLDTSGSGQDESVVDMAVRELGHDRVLFGTDTTMEPAVGRIFAADLTPEQREAVFWRNAEKLLKGRVG